MSKKVFSNLAKEIAIAARDGADPASNARLRMAVEAARKASMTKDTLERAIKKGAGLTDEKVHYDTVTYEGFAPHQVPVIVECLTENKNRTSSDVRTLFGVAPVWWTPGPCGPKRSSPWEKGRRSTLWSSGSRWWS